MTDHRDHDVDESELRPANQSLDLHRARIKADIADNLADVVEHCARALAFAEISTPTGRDDLVRQVRELLEGVSRTRPGPPYSDPTPPAVVAYHGRRTGGPATVTVSREGGVQEDLPHVCRHSPDGFEWGYAGSGPSDLALSLLTYHRGGEPDPGLYHAFRDTVIAHLDDARWTLTAGFVDDWLARHEPHE